MSCLDCHATRAEVLASLCASECPHCRTLYLPPDDECAARAAPLGEAIADVALALRWEREHADAAPRTSGSPLARLQGIQALPDGAGNQSPSALVGLASVMLDPRSKFGRKARAAFVAALLTYCERTSEPEATEVDWCEARSLAERFARLDPAHRQTLAVLIRETGPDVAWEVAALVIAHALAPRALRASWYQVTHDGPGRPRVDATRPPPEIAAREWGETRLRAALLAWGMSAPVTGA